MLNSYVKLLAQCLTQTVSAAWWEAAVITVTDVVTDCTSGLAMSSNSVLLDKEPCPFPETPGSHYFFHLACYFPFSCHNAYLLLIPLLHSQTGSSMLAGRCGLCDWRNKQRAVMTLFARVAYSLCEVREGCQLPAHSEGSQAKQSGQHHSVLTSEG